jgi:hypothetical protein
VIRVGTYMLVPAARSTVQAYGDEVAVAMFSICSKPASAGKQ